MKCGEMYSNYDTCTKNVALHTNYMPLCEFPYENCPGCSTLQDDFNTQTTKALGKCVSRREAMCSLTLLPTSNNYDYASLYACCLNAAPPSRAACLCEFQQTAGPVCSSCGNCSPGNCGVPAGSSVASACPSSLGGTTDEMAILSVRTETKSRPTASPFLDATNLLVAASWPQKMVMIAAITTATQCLDSCQQLSPCTTSGIMNGACYNSGPQPLGSSGLTLSEACTLPCVGDKTQNCGGATSMLLHNLFH